MNQAITIRAKVRFRRDQRNRKRIRQGPAPIVLPKGSVPRVSRLMALAIRFERLLSEGIVANYAELARLGRVSRPRISQVMNLLHLAPDLQEAILFLPRTVRGRARSS